MIYGCLFCAEQFVSIPDQASHLVNVHPGVRVGESSGLYLVRYRSVGIGSMVRCFCGQRFSCNRETTPLFDLLGHFVPERDSFTAHLRREGGLEKHLAWLQDQELLRIVAGEATPEGKKRNAPANAEPGELFT